MSDKPDTEDIYAVAVTRIANASWEDAVSLEETLGEEDYARFCKIDFDAEADEELFEASSD